MRRRGKLSELEPFDWQASVSPARVDGEVHPVPVMGAILFLCLTVPGVFFVVTGALGVGILMIVVFGALAGAFTIECIPSRAEMTDQGISFRLKLRKDRVLWSEVAALGTDLPSEHSPGKLLVRLTAEAASARGLEPERMFHFALPANEATPQERFLVRAAERWRAAGGSGATFDVLSAFEDASRTLVEVGAKLRQMNEDPDTFAARGWMGKSCTVRRGEPEPGAPDGVYCIVAHATDTAGALFFCIIAGSGDWEKLASTLSASATRLAREHRDSLEWSGVLQISLVPDLTPDTPPLRAGMDQLVQKLEQELTGAATAPRSRAFSLEVSWCYGHPARTWEPTG